MAPETAKRAQGEWFVNYDSERFLSKVPVSNETGAIWYVVIAPNAVADVECCSIKQHLLTSGLDWWGGFRSSQDPTAAGKHTTNPHTHSTPSSKSLHLPHSLQKAKNRERTPDDHKKGYFKIIWIKNQKIKYKPKSKKKSQKKNHTIFYFFLPEHHHHHSTFFLLSPKVISSSLFGGHRRLARLLTRCSLACRSSWPSCHI